jgi:hypothetical protein
VDERDKLLEEAAACRELAREIKDKASVAMLLERAAQLDARIAEMTGRSDGQGRCHRGRAGRSRAALEPVSGK